jgi:hypothetical protein
MNTCTGFCSPHWVFITRTCAFINAGVTVQRATILGFATVVAGIIRDKFLGECLPGG